MRVVACFVVIVLALGGTGRADDNDKPATWRHMAEADLRFIHDAIAAHHPGPIDVENPAFRRWHARGFQLGLSRLDEVKSYGGYRSVVQRYVAGFRDGHLSLSPSLQYRNAGWPGFVLAWRNGRFEVHHVADGLAAPVVGDVLVECDGKNGETLFEERVLSLAGKEIPADRHELAPEMLVDRVDPLQDNLSRCVFARGEERQTVDLQWRWVPASSLDTVLSRAGNGERGVFNVREVAGNGVWISIPTFGPGADDLARMQAMMAGLPQARTRDYIVIDVRRNGGGSSYWAEVFTRGLYGDEYYESTSTGSEGYAVHRVSPENIEHFKQLDAQVKQQAGEKSEFYQYFHALVLGLEQARADGLELYEHRFGADSDPLEPRIGDPPPPLYRGKVYFLTDSACGSACLDFADEVLEIPGVIHVGQPTTGDTLYMEVRSVWLPSNNARFSFATKVWRKRDRGPNEYYTPVHEWQGDIWNTPELESWILGLQK